MMFCAAGIFFGLFLFVGVTDGGGSEAKSRLCGGDCQGDFHVNVLFGTIPLESKLGAILF
jgi:hypothetical protein